MSYRIAVGASLAAVVLASGIMAEGTVKSGPQVGDKVVVPFNPLHCNGPDKDKKLCLV
jgi:hypothetical protein